MRVLLLTTLLCAGLAYPAEAADQAATLRNPFLTAAEYMALAGQRPAATLHLVYKEEGAGPASMKVDSTVSIDLASDWTLLAQGGRSTLIDFVLQRIFTIDTAAGTFVSATLSTVPYGRLEARTARYGQQFAFKAMGQTTTSDCDSDTELTLTIPAMMADTIATVDDGAGGLAETCNGRRIGDLRFDPDRAAPSVLWPVLAQVFPIEPALLAAAQQRGRLPSRLEADFRVPYTEAKAMPRVADVSRRWTLVSANATDLPYSLPAGLRNANAQVLAAATSPRLARLAQDALDGVLLPPTARGWDATLAVLMEADPAEAALRLIPTIMMFPASAHCESGIMPAACALFSGLRFEAGRDPAVGAAVYIMQTDTGSYAKARAASGEIFARMKMAQASPLANDPVLRAAFANVLAPLMPMAALPGSEVQKAKGMGLPVDLPAAREAAIEAYPFNPSYWTDLAGQVNDKIQLSNQTDYTAVTLIWEIAMKLPMPDARNNNYNLRLLQHAMSRFPEMEPQFFLATP